MAERTVYLIRHAESRYNAGAKAYSLAALLRECDHGLSSRGLEQCLALRSSIERWRASRDRDAVAIAKAEPLASPLRRALQTAHLALGASRVVALPDGREPCAAPVFARDSVGTARSLIEAELRREVGSRVDVDTRAIDLEEWWTVAESTASVDRRLRRLLLDLHARAAAAPCVYVGHSRAIREIFRRFAQEPDYADFHANLVANCAVLKLRVGVAHNDDPVILGANFLFGTTFQPPRPDLLAWAR
ncbi:hypothetical protein CTAYLR_008126 [Chrysophaeum taylorii]|uniref:Uncharacterized protein n=1 Tax=Chrysophaeum taylorii TaxID=2483200 RepID=A0AAD7ULV5_9STRA|nr:hypothetical protein CTAYLR_008126 [Chrysophaeum taylorii]